MEDEQSDDCENAIDNTTEVTPENLVYFLEEDSSFVDFFNAFLSLPTFAQRLFYNTSTQSFEEFDQKLADNIRFKNGEKSQHQRTIIKRNNVEHRARIGYYVKFLSKEEGFQWVKENRLPSFLKSELYAQFKISRYLADSETKYLEILLQDALITDQRLRQGSSQRSDRRFTLFPGLASFKEQTIPDNERLDSIAHDSVKDKALIKSRRKPRGRPSATGITEENFASASDVNEELSLNAQAFSDEDSVFEDSVSEMYPIQNVKDNRRTSLTHHSTKSMSELENQHTVANDDIGKRGVQQSPFRKPIRERSSSVSYSFGKERSLSLGNIKPKLKRRATISEGKLQMSVSVDQLKDSFSNRKVMLKRRETLLSLFTDCDDESDEEEKGVERLVIQKVEEPKPLDLGIKAGVDAFKGFLVDTSGEKLLSLWIEIERLKYLSGNDRIRGLQKVRKSFLCAGSQYELSESMKNVLQSALVSTSISDNLVECQNKALLPLLTYWCPRFLLHNKISLKSSTRDYVCTDHHCTSSRCSSHFSEFDNLPQRPVTCIPHVRTNEKASNDADYERKRACLQEQSGVEKSETLKKMRNKSAHPRMTSTAPLRETNAGYLQLLLLTAPDDNDVGFRSLGHYSYHNDAAENDLNYRRNIRLYLQPTPPPDFNYSVIKRVEGDKISGKKTDANKSYEQTLSLLAEALLLEKHSGEHFLEYLKTSDNQFWMNCYSFWRDLRDYTESFFTDTFQSSRVQQKASILYSNYVLSSSSHDICCSSTIQDKIYKALCPPYEDLFDDAEEHILSVLVKPWTLMLQEELSRFEKLNREQRLKYIEVRRKEKRQISNVKKEVSESESEEEDDREKISVDEIGLPLAVPKDGVTLDSILKDKDEREFFQKFLEGKDKKAFNDFLAWLDIESFRRLAAKAPKKTRDSKATSIGKKWFGKDYFFGPDSPATKDGQAEVKKFTRDGNDFMPERPPSPVILEAQRYIRARLERRWLLMYKETSEYINRRKAKSNVSDMVEDMMMKRRLQRSEAAWKILNSRWISGSRDVVSLRQTLLDPIKCHQFKMYVCQKGDLLENSVNFWLEVQKFKELCHYHVDNFAVTRKIQAVIEVYIKSSIPPELQIDVPIEIAERLYDKAAGRTPQHGPYLFREAQTTVFRILFSYWKDFVSFRATIAEEKLSQHLEELRKKHIAQRRAKRMASERRRLAKISAEKRKKDKEEKIRMRAVSDYASTRSIDDEEEIETRVFSYSKHLAEVELKELEQRMRDNGLTVDELTDLDAATQSMYFSKTERSKKGSSGQSEENKSSKSFSVRSRLGDSLMKKQLRSVASIREDTIQEAPSLEDQSEDGKSTGIDQGKLSLKSKWGQHINLDVPDKRSRRSKSKTGSHKGGSSVKESKLVSANISSLMPGPKRESSLGGPLTMESLKKFDKISLANPSGAPPPLIRISRLQDCASSNTTEKVTKSENRKKPSSSQLFRSGRKQNVNPYFASGSALESNSKVTVI